jgi:Raf kinase inhibitor-like YbhB/YbcL family protein
MAAFELTSPAFEQGGAIPARFTCEGENVSPPLRWSGVPDGTVTLALTCYDPDAPSGTFVHWLGWGIEPDAGELEEGEAAPIEGRNGFGEVGWGGPCPPPGHGPHRYFFRLHALSAEPSLAAGADREQLDAAIATEALAGAELTGIYER